MSQGQILHMNEVANAGAIARRIIHSENVDAIATAGRGLAGDLDEVGCAARRLAGAACWVCARDIEVAQVMSFRGVAQHQLRHHLGCPVGRDRPQRRVLADRDRAGVP